MRSEDAHLLDSITTALNNLRAQGTPLGVDIRQVVMTVQGSSTATLKPLVRYSFDDQSNDWDITAE